MVTEILISALQEPGLWDARVLAFGGSLFVLGVMAGWMVAWFVLAATQPKTPSEE